MTAIQSPFNTASALAPAALDSLASDFSPDGVAAPGVLTVAAPGDHVHPEKAWDALLCAPAGALAETAPRFLAGATLTPTTGTTYVTAIALPKGTVVTNITLLTGTAASSGTTHSWFGLLDSTGKVVAVSADGLTANLANSAFITYAMGAPYTVTAAGLFYVAQSVTATGMCNWASVTTSTVAAARTPVLCGTAGTNNAPPALAATLTITATTANNYGYVS